MLRGIPMMVVKLQLQPFGNGKYFIGLLEMIKLSSKN